MCFHDLCAVPACVLCLSNPGFGRIFRKEKSIFSMIHVAALRLFAVFCLRQMAGCDFSQSACLFITHPEGIASLFLSSLAGVVG
jgi:hypothetical protein